MKLVILNPYLNAEHETIAALKKRGASVLLTQTMEEAWTVLQLHGASVDLGVFHREGAGGKGEPGLELVKKLRESKDHADLPYVLTYEKWSQQDCAAHQVTSQGANAYLHYPFTANDLPALIHQITGTSLIEKTGGLIVGQHTNSKISLAADPGGSTKSEGPALLEITLGPELTLEPELNTFASPPATPQVPKAPPLAPVALTPVLTPTTTPPLSPTNPATPAAPNAIFSSPPVEPATTPAPSAKEFLLNLFASRSSSVVPGKAGQSLDEDSYRKHLALRERDIASLSSQVENFKRRIEALEGELESEKTLNSELERNYQDAKRKLDHYDRDKQAEIRNRQSETEKLLQEARTKNEKIAIMEARVKDAEREVQSIRERVRADLQKIRGRERELENRIEILTRDSEVLLASREAKILELKRRLDSSDFNAELLNEKLEQERLHVKKLQGRLESIAQAMKLADGFADENSEKNNEQPRSSH